MDWKEIIPGSVSAVLRVSGLHDWLLLSPFSHSLFFQVQFLQVAFQVIKGQGGP